MFNYLSPNTENLISHTHGLLVSKLLIPLSIIKKKKRKRRNPIFVQCETSGAILKCLKHVDVPSTVRIIFLLAM